MPSTKDIAFPANVQTPLAQITIIDSGSGDCNVVDFAGLSLEGDGSYKPGTWTRTVIDVPEGAKVLNALNTVCSKVKFPDSPTNKADLTTKPPVRKVIITHIDEDHIGSAADFLKPKPYFLKEAEIAFPSLSGVCTQIPSISIKDEAISDPREPRRLLEVSLAFSCPALERMAESLKGLKYRCVLQWKFRYADKKNEPYWKECEESRTAADLTASLSCPTWDFPRKSKIGPKDGRMKVSVQMLITDATRNWTKVQINPTKEHFLKASKNFDLNEKLDNQWKLKSLPSQSKPIHAFALPLQHDVVDTTQSFHSSMALRSSAIRSPLSVQPHGPGGVHLLGVESSNKLEDVFDLVKGSLNLKRIVPVSDYQNNAEVFANIQSRTKLGDGWLRFVGPSRHCHDDVLRLIFKHNWVVGGTSVKDKRAEKNNVVTNRGSIVSMFTREHGAVTFQALFTGDAYDQSCDIRDTISSWTLGISQQLDPPSIYVDVLKVPHHGSDTTVRAEFYRFVRASVYIFSGQNVGHKNPKFTTLQTIVQGFKKPNEHTADGKYKIFFSSAEANEPAYDASAGSKGYKSAAAAMVKDSQLAPSVLKTYQMFMNWRNSNTENGFGRILLGYDAANKLVVSIPQILAATHNKPAMLEFWEIG
ncbi:Putative ribonuclease Z/Hydroxyacylglutathione hydrolase [Septoria linicola]|uniref:Ribonuclease Z/Hydroxyacylglutathione hydrolase n=1 Tax=Septoria linicola TaxID=215465 RepID=A0A9Q9EG55_9PEZI|nr:putative ribonuclease Z/Hydroxyacylglutathione hydrolase [Septoria linicola]USW50476.1 Putative ribonuclease Z/Hydroxyacylglutathione hydrolase [Septoria linicola]